MKKVLTKVLACAMAVTVGGAIFSGCVSGSGVVPDPEKIRLKFRFTVEVSGRSGP